MPRRACAVGLRLTRCTCPTEPTSSRCPPRRELTEDELALVDLARRTIDATTDAGPGEDGAHTMGAAVRADDGRVFAGVNLYHFTGGPCAELVALGAAGCAACGPRRSRTSWRSATTDVDPAGPCGRDRQVLLDYHPGVRRHPADEPGLVASRADRPYQRT